MPLPSRDNVQAKCIELVVIRARMSDNGNWGEWLTECCFEEEAVSITTEEVPHTTGHVQWQSAGVDSEYPMGKNGIVWQQTVLYTD